MVRAKDRGREVDVEPPVSQVEASVAVQEADSEADRDSVPQVPLDFGKLHRPHNRDLNGEGRVYLKREEVDRTAELDDQL